MRRQRGDHNCTQVAIVSRGPDVLLHRLDVAIGRIDPLLQKRCHQQLGDGRVGLIIGRHAHDRGNPTHPQDPALSLTRQRAIHPLIGPIADVLQHRLAARRPQRSAVVIQLDKLDRRHDHCIADFQDRLRPQHFLQQTVRLIPATPQQPLVQALMRLQHRLIAEQHV